MFFKKSKAENTASAEDSHSRNTVAEIANILEELIYALVMALLIIVFVVQPFIIPTGSMADTLKGAHFRLRCPQCGYRYDRNFEPRDYGISRNTVPGGFVRPPVSRCPSCGYYNSGDTAMPVVKGDKILALKCLYQFFEPKRWDIVVFNNPIDPSENYIKRLIGKPGETVEIIDGDIYINGGISRKPPKVQDELWMLVYDNDYRPVNPQISGFNGHRWKQPLRNAEDSKWTPDKADPTGFDLSSLPEQVNWLVYDSTLGNDFRTAYAYDPVGQYAQMPYCSDLMVRFYADFAEPDTPTVAGAGLSKYLTDYKAWVDSAGEMFISKIYGGLETILKRKTIELPFATRPCLLKFANVDHRLIFEFGSEKLIYDLGRSAEGAGSIETEIEPEVKIFGSGRLTLSHIAVFRDIHYLSRGGRNGSKSGIATQGKPFELGEDEFFVLGDNSPASLDGRWWPKPGIGNNGESYRMGVVPRDYLMGKAFVVFWPSGFKPFEKFPFSLIPNVNEMRLIYGGSNRIE